MSDLKNSFEDIHYRMNEEGFDYCFDKYSDWSEIKDEKFQKLKEQYLKSKKELEQYIIDKYNSYQ